MAEGGGVNPPTQQCG